MNGPGGANAAREGAATRGLPGAATLAQAAYDEAYDSARAGLLSGSSFTHAQLGDLVLEDEDDLADLMAAMRHAVAGDVARAGVMVALLAAEVLHRHASAVAALELMRAAEVRHAQGLSQGQTA